jgi:hypothetical protein
MKCQHMYCGNTHYSNARPLSATWIVRHSGYKFPICDAHYGVLRAELIGADIDYTIETVKG